MSSKDWRGLGAHRRKASKGSQKISLLTAGWVIITLTVILRGHMANQRKKGLKLVGAYVTEKVHKALKAEAKRRGITLAELLRLEIAEITDREKSDHEQSKGS